MEFKFKASRATLTINPDGWSKPRRFTRPKFYPNEGLIHAYLLGPILLYWWTKLR